MQQTHSLSFASATPHRAQRDAARGRPAKSLSRACVRTAWFAAEIALAACRWMWLGLCAGGAPGWRERAAWVHRTARRARRIFNLELQVTGPVPSSGLLVANHLSYLDIVVLAALAPAAFVAKRDVRSWPVFGMLARMAGTLFIQREKRADTARLAPELARLLEAGALVVVFPEGTSSDGSEVLPFRSSLLEAAVWRGTAIHTAYLEYELDDGNPGAEVCYWGTMTLVPHLWNLLGKARVRAKVAFSETPVSSADRKELARVARDEVVRLKDRLAHGITPCPAHKEME
jgi:1-acyl-sn-glycerol-3-phosphate acyltransferase